jgi:hypothetical protein
MIKKSSESSYATKTVHIYNPVEVPTWQIATEPPQVATNSQVSPTANSTSHSILATAALGLKGAKRWTRVALGRSMI